MLSWSPRCSCYSPYALMTMAARVVEIEVEEKMMKCSVRSSSRCPRRSRCAGSSSSSSAVGACMNGWLERARVVKPKSQLALASILTAALSASSG